MNQIKVDTSLPLPARFAFLRYCADLYETNGTSPITDKQYDTEYAALEAIEPENEFFSEVGGMSDEHIYGTHVKHDIIMGSLSKSQSVEEFLIWLKLAYPQCDVAFVLQHKVDGLSLSLLYRNGKLVQALTRGNGSVGIDVTENAKYVKGVLPTIPYDGEEVEVRGECFKDRQDFYRKWHTSVGGEYANPRNFTSGSINQKDAKVTGERGLEFVAYEVVRKPFTTETEKNAWLEKQGFRTLNAVTRRTKVGLSHEQVAKAVQTYMDSCDRFNLPYDIDGIVVKCDDIKVAQGMGSVNGGRKPKASRAVKFPAEQKETKLIGVEANVGRTGAVVPVGILEGVELGGAMIRRVTLHNYGAIISDPDMKIGSVVIIAKKGDIIPQIVAVKKSGNKDFELPKVCPSCGTELEWDANKVHLICSNYALCSAQVTSRIEHWLSTIGVKGIGKGILGRLTDKEELEWEGRAILASIPEIYFMLDNDRISKHPFRKYAFLREQFGDKAFQNIIDNVNSVKEIPLNTFIEALGIGKIGSMAKDITNIAPTVADIDKLTVSDLLSIPGFASIKANNFINGWKALRSEIDQLLKYIKIVQVVQASSKLTGKSFCFTGSFENPSRGEMEKMVPDNGGKLGSVSKNLTALVFDGASMKGKYEKAQKLGVPIITQDEFMKLLQ